MSAASVAKKRGILLTVLATIVGGIVGGLLYIGRGHLAVAFWLLSIFAIVLIYFAGLPEFPYGGPGSLYYVLLIGLNLLAVLILRMHPVITRWYSNWVVAVVIGLISTFAPAILIRTFAIQPFSTPSSSMEPALNVGDYFFASKWPYGYNWASSFYWPASLEIGLSADDPERGDVVVFKLPRNTRIDYVKRVIGLPGDVVQYKNGMLFINGEQVPRKKAGKVKVNNGVDEGLLYRETLPGGRIIEIIETGEGSHLDTTEEFSVPEGHYFVLGDNRDNSIDSRDLSVGFIPDENIFARAERIFWNDEGKPFRARRNLNSR